MNLDEARGRLQKASMYMGADQAIEDAEGAGDLRDQLRIIFAQHADKPIMVHRMIHALIDEIVADQVPGYNHPLVKVFCTLIRSDLDSIAYLASEGFEEGAWFRASNAITSCSLYLEAIEWAAKYPSPNPERAPAQA